MKSMENLIRKYSEQAKKYREEFTFLELKAQNGNIASHEEANRLAETEVLYNKCLEIVMDLRHCN